MASAAEQMAANLSWGALGQAKDLQRRIMFTLGLLIVYRLGTFIPMPGIDTVQLKIFMEQAQGGILGVFNMFAGGAMMPMKMISEMPLPMPRAVICSPSHIRNMVPPTKVITAEARKKAPGSTASPCPSSPTEMP